MTQVDDCLRPSAIHLKAPQISPELHHVAMVVFRLPRVFVSRVNTAKVAVITRSIRARS